MTTTAYMFFGADAFYQDLGWCLDDDVDALFMCDDTPCQSTNCGITQGNCTFAPTPAPSSMSPTELPTYTKSPTPEPTPRPHSDDATTAGASLLLAAATALALA